MGSRKHAVVPSEKLRLKRRVKRKPEAAGFSAHQRGGKLLPHAFVDVDHRVVHRAVVLQNAPPIGPGIIHDHRQSRGVVVDALQIRAEVAHGLLRKARRQGAYRGNDVAQAIQRQEIRVNHRRQAQYIRVRACCAARECGPLADVVHRRKRSRHRVADGGITFRQAARVVEDQQGEKLRHSCQGTSIADDPGVRRNALDFTEAVLPFVSDCDVVLIEKTVRHSGSQRVHHVDPNPVGSIQRVRKHCQGLASASNADFGSVLGNQIKVEQVISGRDRRIRGYQKRKVRAALRRKNRREDQRGFEPSPQSQNFLSPGAHGATRLLLVRHRKLVLHTTLQHAPIEAQRKPGAPRVGPPIPFIVAREHQVVGVLQQTRLARRRNQRVEPADSLLRIGTDDHKVLGIDVRKRDILEMVREPHRVDSLKPVAPGKHLRHHRSLARQAHVRRHLQREAIERRLRVAHRHRCKHIRRHIKLLALRVHQLVHGARLGLTLREVRAHRHLARRPQKPELLLPAQHSRHRVVRQRPRQHKIRPLVVIEQRRAIIDHRDHKRVQNHLQRCRRPGHRSIGQRHR
mmetsp:Transcript_24676/g.64932  ORF Transcript_24676/g.64932 Transcript_24676/m.64932 type:complete len:571 (-) Transcript_24676:962-2674(-)